MESLIKFKNIWFACVRILYFYFQFNKEQNAAFETFSHSTIISFSKTECYQFSRKLTTKRNREFKLIEKAYLIFVYNQNNTKTD